MTSSSSGKNTKMSAYSAMSGAKMVLGEKSSLLSSSKVRKTKNNSAQKVRLFGTATKTAGHQQQKRQQDKTRGGHTTNGGGATTD